MANRILSKGKALVIEQVRKKLHQVEKAEEDEAEKVSKSLDLDFLNEFGTAGFLSVLEDRAIESSKQFIIEIGIPQNTIQFGQVNQRAVQYVQERGAELISMIDNSTRNGIRDIIADSLERKLSLEQIAAELSASYEFSDERALLIAETEVANANSYGSLAGMYELRAQGVRIKKIWLPDSLACPICEENGSIGAIDLDDAFPSGNDAPLAHVNCRCDLGSQID